jgi:two-component system sensor histidine kinase TctE
MPAARSREEAAKPRFYRDTVHGEPVRMLVARMPVERPARSADGAGAGRRNLNKRTRFAWEMVANVVVPQLLLIVMATAVVWFGVSRGLEPLQRLRRAVSDRSHLDLSPIDTHDVPGEVRPLVEEVNELMARLGEPSISRTASWPTPPTS